MSALEAVIGLRRNQGIPQWRSGTFHGMPAEPRPIPVPLPQINMTIGRFDLLKKLDEGAMGSIYLARDFFNGRLSAVKLARMNLHSFIFEEAKILSSLAHRNIVTYVESGNQEGTEYLTMEYITGRTVAALIQDKLLDLPKTLDIISQVCFGLNYLQEKGIVHCDIKPSNIMVQPDGTVKIIDFGLARKEGATAGGRGSLRYCAPEQAKDQPIDTRADLYSLGVTFNDALIFLNVHSRISDYMLQRFSPIVKRMTAEDPRDRYQTPLEIVADIRKLQMN